jgi:formylglycine-generating enzyme required for sulfatase activity
VLAPVPPAPRAEPIPVAAAPVETPPEPEVIRVAAAASMELHSAETAVRPAPAEPPASVIEPPRPRRGAGKRSPKGRTRRSGAPLPSGGDPAWASDAPPATEGALAIGPATSALEPIQPETPRIETPSRPVRAVSFGAAEEKRRSRGPFYAAGAIALALIAGAVAATLARSPAETAPVAQQQPAAEPAPKAPEPPKPAVAEVAPEQKVVPSEPSDRSRSLSDKVRSVRERAAKALAERKRKREEALAEAAAKRAAEEKAKKAAAAPIPAPKEPVKPPSPAGAIRGLDDSEILAAKDRSVVVPSKASGQLVAAAVPAVATAAAAEIQCPPGMIKVLAGPAALGSDAADDLRNFGDRPLSTVSLQPYCIDLYEFPNQPGRLPKVAAAFSEAESLCRNSGKRLCSEDEWEKACKGPQQTRFPYGQSFDADACNTQDKSDNPRQTTVAGAFTRCRSGYGLWDMSGNAAEWTATAFDAAGPEKVVKGGHAARPSFDDRCASRRKLAPTVHDVKVGFRCCADAR